MQKYLWVLGLTILLFRTVSQGQCVPDLPPVNPQYTLGGRTISVSNVHINTGGSTAVMTPGEAFNVSFDWTIGPDLTACPGCVTFFHFGLSNVSVPGAPSATTYPNTHCMGSVFPNQSTSSSGSFAAPIEPGFYYITLVSKWVFWCHQYSVNHCNNKIIALIQVGTPGAFQVTLDSLHHLSGCDTDDGAIGISVENYTGCFSTSWTGPDGYSVNNQTVITDLAAGDYEVNVSDIAGCDTTLYITIDDVLSEEVDLGVDTILCEGETLQLNATVPGATYLWQDGSMDSIYDVVQPGTYSVEVTAGNCTSVDEIDVAYQDILLDLGPAINQCGGSVVLDATNQDATYQWSDGSIGPTINVSGSGTYDVTVTIGRCASSDMVDITIDTPFTIDIGEDTSICGGSLSLNASHPNSTYLWQDGSTDASFNVSATGTYDVEVTSGECMATDVIAITVDVPEAIDLGVDTGVCSGAVVVLDASVINGSYLWQDGSTTPTYPVTQEGTYSVQVSTSNSCPDLSDDIVVTYLEVPSLPAIEDTSLCDGGAYIVQIDNTDDNILWSDGGTASSNTFVEPGTYWVSVSNNCGSASDTFVVSIDICDCKMITPSAFSPDGNGHNELFFPFFTCDISYFDMRIYNRWGELVYQSDDAAFGWDGFWDGSLQEMDTYIWVVEYVPIVQNEEGERVMESGAVLLFR